MSLSILTDTAAMDTHRNLLAASDLVAKSMQRLSSGLRINSAADDAAGYAISQGLMTQVNGLDQAGRNIGDAISMVQTTASSLTNVENMLQRIRELAVQYQNGDLSSTDKADVQSEVDQLTQEINRQRQASSFNGISLLDGTVGTSGIVTFQVGSYGSDTLTLTFNDIEGTNGLASSLGFTWSNVNNSGAHVFDLGQANAISNLDVAILNISSMGSTLGAVQNRLTYTASAISTAEENMSASNSRITDVDMASEMTQLTEQQILEQAGTAMLAQANSQPQLVLKLLG
jgi:flagellin